MQKNRQATHPHTTPSAKKKLTVFAASQAATAPLPPETIQPDRFAYSDIKDIVRVPGGFICAVKFEAEACYLTFLASPIDVEAHGRAIHAACEARAADGVPDYFPSDAEVLEATQERMARELSRANRAVTQYQDRVDVDEASESDIAQLIAWKRYRVGLHRIPDQEGFPHCLTWPVAPDTISL